MASEEIVWSILTNQFCSFKLALPGNKSSTQKSTKQTFCRNEHNVTGLCNRQSCPLANNRYATIRSDPETQRLYLYIKTVERAHLPSKWWEKVRLSGNYTKALQQVDEVRVRAQRLLKEEERLGETLVPRLAPKIRRREETRERKAEAAAKIERAIERELVERLRSGAYGDRPLNVEERVWEKVMRGLERSQEGVVDEDLGEEEEEGVEYEYEREGQEQEVEYDWLGGESGGDATGSEDDDDDDEEDADGDSAALKKKLDGLKRKRPSAPTKKPAKKPVKRAKANIEYEYEPVPEPREMLLAD
nr:hypothetical protein B0A51_14919 [Rachicladosporium sp. CCFEE 5018]